MPELNWDEITDKIFNEAVDEGDPPPQEPAKRKRGSAKEAPPEEDMESTFLAKKAADSIQKLLGEPPVAFVEPEGQKPYQSDPTDRLVPEETFISDFVNMGRMTETPTIFLIWGALWTLSTALDRRAWLQWFPKPLWPNLYVLFVAPPGLCKKSMPIDFGVACLQIADTMRPDTIAGFERGYRFLTSKGSPEGLYMMLKPERRTFVDTQSNMLHQAERTSKVTIAVSELATFLGRQQYNTGLVNLITDLYDCKAQDAEVTRGRGIEPLKDIYVTMAGAITPTGLEQSIPEEALSGGLMSRVVTCYQDTPTKIYSRPTRLHGYPEPKEVAQKLAWIQANCVGEYVFTPEAEQAFEDWYRRWKADVISGKVMLREDENRKDTLIRKVAMLLRVAEYTPGNEITVWHFEAAKTILDYTLTRAAPLVGDLGVPDFGRKLKKIYEFFEKRKTATRRQCLNRFSRQIASPEMTVLLNQLVQEGKIRVTINGKETYTATQNSAEVYTFVEIGV